MATVTRRPLAYLMHGYIMAMNLEIIFTTSETFGVALQLTDKQDC
jgi:hypothetical protein